MARVEAAWFRCRQRTLQKGRKEGTDGRKGTEIRRRDGRKEGMLYTKEGTNPVRRENVWLATVVEISTVESSNAVHLGKEGRKEERKKGRKEGRKEGREEGRKEGRKEGR
jgi:hypothetical protein